MKVTQNELRALVREMIEEDSLLPLQRGGTYASTSEMPITMTVGTQFTVEDVQVRNGVEYVLLKTTDPHGNVRSFWRATKDLLGGGKNWLTKV